MARVPAAMRLNELEQRLMTQYDLAIGSHAQGDKESPKKFLDRLATELPEILIRAEGHIEIAALVFRIDSEMIEDLKKYHPQITEAQIQGIGIRTARETQAATAANRLKEEQLRRYMEEDPSPTRTDPLPKDPTLRKESIKAMCPRYLRAYSGCKYQMSAPMGVPSEEIQAAIDTDKELIELQSVCQAAPKSAALRNLEQQAASGSYAASSKYLEKMFPEEFGQKQDINFKNSGFEPPPPLEALSNALFSDKEPEECEGS